MSTPVSRFINRLRQCKIQKENKRMIFDGSNDFERELRKE
jgi:hypothetical protein